MRSHRLQLFVEAFESAADAMAFSERLKGEGATLKAINKLDDAHARSLMPNADLCNQWPHAVEYYAAHSIEV